jgi:hypothetical protein
MPDLVGTWRLTAVSFVGQETGERLDLFGPEPFGYAIFAPTGRMVVLITSTGRTPAASGSEMAALFRSMVTYTGRWSLDGERLVTRVNGAWDPSWVGTEQVRDCTFAPDGRTLSVRTAPMAHSALPGQRAIGYLGWKREG